MKMTLKQGKFYAIIVASAAGLALHNGIYSLALIAALVAIIIAMPTDQ